MKWIILMATVFILNACVTTTSTDIVEYRQVAVDTGYTTQLDDYWRGDYPLDVTDTTVDFY